MDRIDDIVGTQMWPVLARRAAQGGGASQGLRSRLLLIPQGQDQPDEDREDDGQMGEDWEEMLGTVDADGYDVEVDGEPDREQAPVSGLISSRPIRQIPQSQQVTSRVGAQPVCTLCHGAGYVRMDVAYGHPQFGKAVPCACKIAEQNQRAQQHHQSLSRLETLARFQSESFDTFEVLSPVKMAYNAAIRFSTRPKGWLILAGPNGCGKTHLAVAIAKEQLTNRVSVLFLVVADLLDHLRSAYAPNAEIPYDALLEQMRSVEVLILDDLGAEHSTPWAEEKLFQLLNYRYNAMFPTVITTNRQQLEGIEPRLRSRLSDRQLVMMVTMADAQDYRPTMLPMDENE